MQLLDVANKLSAALQELWIRIVELWFREHLHGLGLRGLVEAVEPVLTHGQFLRHRGTNLGLVDLHGFLAASPELLLDNGSPCCLDGGHCAIVDCPAILRGQTGQCVPRNIRASDHLRPDGRVNLLCEGLDLCLELWPQGLKRQPLDVPELTFIGNGPHKSCAIPAAEQVLDGIAHSILVLLTGKWPEGILQVGLLGHHAAALVHQP
mmetsp:Transcript_114217/g.317962  ORF Transcript_114217/g.317962 Transcript_114217/m.317962 type:complete len:207 (-) Transcript_114217:643-1263(-)